MYSKNVLSKEEEERSNYLSQQIEKLQKILEAMIKENRAIIYKIESGR